MHRRTHAFDSICNLRRVRDVALDYIYAVPVFQAFKVHEWQVEYAHGLPVCHQLFHEHAAHAARASRNKNRTAHVSVTPFMPAFSIRFCDDVMSVSIAVPKLSQSSD